MYNALKRVIESGEFDLGKMEERLKMHDARGMINPAQHAELLELARVKADPFSGRDAKNEYLKHEERIRALEAKLDKLIKQVIGEIEGGETDTVEFKAPYDPYKWYYTGDGCWWNGKNYTCKNSPSTHPCTWSPDANPNRWELDAVQPEDATAN